MTWYSCAVNYETLYDHDLNAPKVGQSQFSMQILLPF